MANDSLDWCRTQWKWLHFNQLGWAPWTVVTNCRTFHGLATEQGHWSTFCLISICVFFRFCPFFCCLTSSFFFFFLVLQGLTLICALPVSDNVYGWSVRMQLRQASLTDELWAPRRCYPLSRPRPPFAIVSNADSSRPAVRIQDILPRNTHKHRESYNHPHSVLSIRTEWTGKKAALCVRGVLALVMACHNTLSHRDTLFAKHTYQW